MQIVTLQCVTGVKHVKLDRFTVDPAPMPLLPMKAWLYLMECPTAGGALHVVLGYIFLFEQ